MGGGPQIFVILGGLAVDTQPHRAIKALNVEDAQSIAVLPDQLVLRRHNPLGEKNNNKTAADNEFCREYSSKCFKMLAKTRKYFIGWFSGMVVAAELLYQYLETL